MTEIFSSPIERKIFKLNLGKIESLTAYDEEFFISEVLDGQDIRVGAGAKDGSYYLRCNFSFFADKLKKVTSEELDSRFVNDGKFEKQFPEMPEFERKLLYTCWMVSKIVQNMLGDVANDDARNNSFARYHGQTESGKNVCVKPLSECRGESVCSEYALMSYHILKKLGVQSAVVVGAFNDNINKGIADRHTFLVLDNGKYVFDPTHTVGQELCWPPKVFAAESPLTAETLKDTSKNLDDPFGVKIVCTDLVTKDQKLYGSGA
ncbi:MAG TPA: hypothetical protein PL066_04235 [bacterium]|nr:hypothetical protein [bacterium]